MELIITCITVFLTILFLFLHHQWRPKRTSTADPSSRWELIKNRHRLVDWTTDLIGASPSGTVTTFMGVITADPAAVEHIVKSRFDIYVKGHRAKAILYDFLGDGIFNSNGDHWKLQRCIASLQFSTKTIRMFVMANVHLEVAGRLLPLLSSAAAAAAPFDIQQLLERFAFDNVCKFVFDEDLAHLDFANDIDNNVAREFNEAFEEASNLSVQRFLSFPIFLWKLKRFLCLGSEKKLKEKIAVVHRFATEVVKRRRERSVGLPTGDDLLSRFIAEDNGYTDEFLRDIITSFVLAGRDTTSTTLTWFFWLVGQRPAVRDRIMDEILRVRAKDPNPKSVFTLEQVKEMKYLHAALSETLRLYPPVPLQGRTCDSKDGDVLPDGTVVTRGTVVMYNSYAMGRSKRLWGEDCREFRPERWLGENGGFRPVSPYVYPVFHAGPRMCLGKDMAYMQMKVVAATVMERFEVELVEEEKETETDQLILIMKMKGGLTVRVRERKEEIVR